MICEHVTTKQTKVIKLGKYSYHQVLESCSKCRLQVTKQLTELKDHAGYMGFRKL